MNFGELVRELRQERGITLQDLSDQSGVDTGSISRIENEKTEATMLVAIRLCRILHVDHCMVASLKQVRRLKEVFEYRCNYKTTGTMLTLYDVHAFARFFQHSPHNGYAMLAMWLSEIEDSLSASKSIGNNVVPKLHSDDINRLFRNSPLYHFDIKYPSEIQASTILQIFRDGGVVISEDVELFAGQMRKDIETRRRTGRQLDSILSRLESGATERVRLLDILALDEGLDGKGDILGMYWCAYAFTAYSPLMSQIERHEAEQETMFATLFVKVCRWLAVVNRADYSWLDRLRQVIQEDKL